METRVERRLRQVGAGELYAAGRSVREVAAAAGVSYGSAWRWLADSGVRMRSPGSRRGGNPGRDRSAFAGRMGKAVDVDVDEIVRLWRQGLGVAQIAEVMRTTYATVRRRLVARGLVGSTKADQ